MLSTLYRRLLPLVCIICSYPTQEKTQLCDDCLKSLPILAQNCQRCGQILPKAADLICYHCQVFPPPFDAIFARFPYQEPITRCIIELKFKGNLSIARAFGTLLVNAIPSWYAGKKLPDIIIPVPLHSQRLRLRGFNQAIEIARPIVSAFGLPLLIEGITRDKDTLPQSELPAAQREKNVSQAFSIQTKLLSTHVAVLDDVITTGHTVRVLSLALKDAGAKKVDIWCCART